MKQGLALNDPTLFLNRELTWLNFNKRVLAMAVDDTIPLLERVKFLSIVSSNLDEFYMKRIGGLKQLLGAGVTELSVDGRTPQQQITICNEWVSKIEKHKDKLWLALKAKLVEQEIFILRYKDLEQADKDYLRAYFLSNIYPLLTPQAVDPAHPFPFISNLSLNLLVTLHYANEREKKLSRVKVPIGQGVPRFVRIDEQYRFVLVEEVIQHNFSTIFPGMSIDSCETFHVIRNANTERDEESANDLLVMIEEELRDRHFAPIVRISIDDTVDVMRLGMLSAELGLDETQDISMRHQMHAMSDLIEIASLPVEGLHDKPYSPVDHPKLYRTTNIFHTIRQHEHILLHHPYYSFSSSVELFLQQASVDPKVRAIKMTVYRTSSDTKVIDHLVNAAYHGKQVAVVVELKARFDEAANIGWASRMEEAGIHVTYGIVGLKTHTKTILVVRQDYNGLQRYSHIGTGNYHAGTARFYSDLGLLTNDAAIGGDLTELFNYLTTGYRPRRHYQKLLPAPKLLKKALLDKIKREIAHQTTGNNGLIQIKANALEDVEMVKALYKASQAGVKIDLIIRDTCRLRPGIEGLSATIRVISIVGRFLEHSRIYYFQNAGDEEYYIGSADPMNRNLESRVEVVTPIEPKPLKKKLRCLLDTELSNCHSVWEMQSDGEYIKLKAKGSGDEKHGASDIGTQEQFMEQAVRAYKEATRLKFRKPLQLGCRESY